MRIAIKEVEKLYIDNFDNIKNSNYCFYCNNENHIKELQKYENVFIFKNYKKMSYNDYLVVITK